VSRNRVRFLLIAQALLLGCGKSRSQQIVPALSASALASVTAANVSASAVANAPETAEHLLNAWTAALNAADVTAPATLYANKVKFYGQSIAREEVLARKRNALAATPGFTQQVLGQPSVLAGRSTRVADSARVVWRRDSCCVR
jgi:hypothetical protein